MRLLSPQWVAVAATLVVVGGAGAAGYVHWHDDAEAPAQAATPVQPGMEEAHAVATALGSLASKPATLVAADVQSAVAGRARQAVPKGSTVTANENSWHPDGLGGGTMTVTITPSGGAPATYSAVMIKEPTGWKVVGTMPMRPAAASSAPAGAGQAPAAQPPAAVNPAVPPAAPAPAVQKPAVTRPGAAAAPGTTTGSAPKQKPAGQEVTPR